MPEIEHMKLQAVSLSGGDAGLIERVSPMTGEVVSREPAMSVADCLSAATRAAAAFPAWSALSAAARADQLCRCADTIMESRTDLTDAMIEEIAAPRAWADHNVEFAVQILREVSTYVDYLDRVENVPDSTHVTSQAARVPCGVCLGLTPWNAPLILGVRSVAAPLLCGNTVILKGNEIAPRTFRLLGDLLNSAGLPRDVLQVVQTRAEDSEAAVDAMIKSPVIRRVNFTGSTRVGRRVAELCAGSLKRPLLELSGQANLIVLEDADLDAAAEAAVHGAYLNQGQICLSTERLIVAEPVADALIERVEALRKMLVVGDPSDNTTQIGPIVSLPAAERLSLLISDAVSKGAQLVGGGGIRGALVEPTLLDGVETDMRLYHEEVFGPILSVTRVSSDAEAVTVANDSEYGLSSGVFGSDQVRTLAVANQLQSGICHINSATLGDNPHAPFGGVKASGYGRFGGRWALDEFTELRWITAQF